MDHAQQLSIIMGYAARRICISPKPVNYPLREHLDKDSNRLLRIPASEYFERLQQSREMGFDFTGDIADKTYYMVYFIAKGKKAVAVSVQDPLEIKKDGCIAIEGFKIDDLEKQEPDSELVNIIAKSIPAVNVKRERTGTCVKLHYSYDASIRPLYAARPLFEMYDESQRPRESYVELTAHKKTKIGKKIRQELRDRQLSLEEKRTGYVELTIHGQEYELQGKRRKDYSCLGQAPSTKEEKSAAEPKPIKPKSKKVVRRPRNPGKVLRIKLPHPDQTQFSFIEQAS